MDETEIDMPEGFLATRAMVRKHLAGDYAEKMAELGTVVQRVSAQTGMCLLATGNEIAKTAQACGEGYMATLLLAATVELVSPTPADELRGAA